MLYERALDLLVTFLGVFFGGIIAFYVAKWQLSKQRDEKEKENTDVMLALKERVKKEIGDNIQIIAYIETVLREAKGSDSKEHWGYVVSYVNAFSKTAYKNLIESGLIGIIPTHDLKRIDEAYFIFDKEYNFAHQQLAAHIFKSREGYVMSLQRQIREYDKPLLKNIVNELNVNLNNDLKEYL